MKWVDKSRSCIKCVFELKSFRFLAHYPTQPMYLMSEIVGVAWVCRLELERKTCPPNWWSRFLKYSTASLRVEEQSVQMSLVCDNESHLPLQAVSINTVKVSQCSYNLLCCPDHLEQASPAFRCPASSPDRVFSLSWTWQCSTVSIRFKITDNLNGFGCVGRSSKHHAGAQPPSHCSTDSDRRRNLSVYLTSI